jgi:hypothetical protein
MTYKDLLKQYVSTGQVLDKNQFDKIKSNLDLINTYFHVRNRVIEKYDYFYRHEVQFLEENPKFLNKLSQKSLITTLEYAKDPDYIINGVLFNRDIKLDCRSIREILKYTSDVDNIFNIISDETICNCLIRISGYEMKNIIARGKDKDRVVKIYINCRGEKLTSDDFSNIQDYITDPIKTVNNILDNNGLKLDLSLVKNFIIQYPEFSDKIISIYGENLREELVVPLIYRLENPNDMINKIISVRKGNIEDDIYNFLKYGNRGDDSVANMLLDIYKVKHPIDIEYFLTLTYDPISIANRIGLDIVRPYLMGVAASRNELLNITNFSKNPPAIIKLFDLLNIKR